MISYLGFISQSICSFTSSNQLSLGFHQGLGRSGSLSKNFFPDLMGNQSTII